MRLEFRATSAEQVLLLDMPDFKRLLIAAVLTACGEVSDSQVPLPDAPAIDPPECVAETDAELCARAGQVCGPISARDNCDEPRTTSCGVCPPVCASFTFTQSPLADELNAAGQQDAIAGFSANGATAISQRRAVCAGPFSLILTEAGASTDITTLPGFDVIAVDREGSVTLTGDGLSVIGIGRSLREVFGSKRSAIGALDFAAATKTGFEAITIADPGQLNNPVLSSDGLALYYQVIAAGPGIDGIYESVRTSTTAGFPPGTRMPENVQAAGFATGISSDRLALFLQANFGMFVLTRSDVSQPFTNPNAPNAAPTVPGFRTRPLGDCQTLIGTCTGGCTGEETCRFTP
ncbi:MAG: hypothetical protein ABI867_32280 [Kofleriaceae bacterium]